MNRYNSVQCLRALAAMSVVAFHASMAGLVGQAGVDVFFVISGFIMWSVTQREVRPGDFLILRLIRVWPLYAIATLWMSMHLRSSILDIVRSLLFIPYLNHGSVWPILIPGWTLNFEMFFYIVFAAVLNLPRLRQFYALSGIMLALVVLGFVFHPTGPIGRTYTSPLLLEFFAGIVIGRAALSGRLPRPLAGSALTAFGLVGFLFSTFISKPEPLRVIIWGVPAASLVLGAISLEVCGALPRLKWLCFLGEASFSIYIFHPFLLKIVEKISRIIPISLRAVFVVFVIGAVGCLIYRVIEKALTDFLRSMVKPMRSRRGEEPEGANLLLVSH